MAALLVTAKKVETVQVSTEQKNKMLTKQKMESYSLVKINDLLIHATAGINVENAVSGRSSHKRPHRRNALLRSV